MSSRAPASEPFAASASPTLSTRNSGSTTSALMPRAAMERRKEARHAAGRLEDDPVEVVDGRRRAVDRLGILGRSVPERRGLNRERPEVLEALHQFLGLLLRSRDDDAPAEERPLIEPTQMVPQRRDLADDKDRDVCMGIC